MIMEYNVKRKMLRGKIGSIYSAQKQLCKRRGYEPPNYNLDEFIIYCKYSFEFLQLHKNWVESGFFERFSTIY